MGDISWDQIEGLVSIDLTFRCGMCGISEESAIGDYSELEDLQGELPSTLSNHGWENTEIEANLDVFCEDCVKAFKEKQDI